MTDRSGTGNYHAQQQQMSNQQNRNHQHRNTRDQPRYNSSTVYAGQFRQNSEENTDCFAITIVIVILLATLASWTYLIVKLQTFENKFDQYERRNERKLGIIHKGIKDILENSQCENINIESNARNNDIPTGTKADYTSFNDEDIQRLDIEVSHEVMEGIPILAIDETINDFADEIAKEILRGIEEKNLEYQVDDSYTDKWKKDIFKCIKDLIESNGYKFDAESEFELQSSDTMISAKLRIKSVDQGAQGVDMESWVNVITRHY